MQEVKWIFNEQYQECNIEQLQGYSRGKYKPGKINNSIVYSVDCIFLKHPERGGRRCDEFIFYDSSQGDTGIYLIEIKDSDKVNVDEVKGQLQGGADFIKDFLNNDPATDNQPFDFTPFCVSKGIRPSVRSKLIQCKIHLQSRHKRIKQINFNRTLR